MTVSKIRYFLREALHNLWQFKTRHAFSLTIICLSFVTVGVFLSLSDNLRFRARELSRNLTIVFYLEPGLAPSDQDLLQAAIRRSPLVGSIRTISPDQASEKFQSDFPDLRDILFNLKSNPFPPSIEVSFKDPNVETGILQAFMADIRKIPGVDDIQFNRDWAEKIRSLGRLVDAVGFFLGGILVLASFFIISNVIKLNVLARQSEIEILRLVGATNTFIRIPFLLEGMIMGIAGSSLSLVLVLILIKAFPVYLGTSLGAIQEIIGFRYLSWEQVLGLIAGGASVGFLGSLSSIARFLRI